MLCESSGGVSGHCYLRFWELEKSSCYGKKSVILQEKCLLLWELAVSHNTTKVAVLLETFRISLEKSHSIYISSHILGERWLFWEDNAHICHHKIDYMFCCPDSPYIYIIQLLILQFHFSLTLAVPSSYQQSSSILRWNSACLPLISFQQSLNVIGVISFISRCSVVKPVTSGHLYSLIWHLKADRLASAVSHGWL